MTSPSDPDPERDRVDVDAAFADIVARWREEHGDPVVPDASPAASAAAPAGDPALDPALDPAPGFDAADGPAGFGEPGVVERDGDHFVPPPPPPLPALEPRRRLAWGALLGVPVVGLLLALLGVAVPRWGALLLVLAFVAGFGYLVATMRPGPPDGWSGDDGAVV